MSKDKYNNYIIRSTQNVIEEFFGSIMWKDIAGLIEADIEDNRDQLENPLLNEVATTLLRGAILQSKGLLELPNDMLQVKEVQDEAALEAAEEEQ